MAEEEKKEETPEEEKPPSEQEDFAELKASPEKVEDVNKERTDEHLLKNIFDPEMEEKAREWLSTINERAEQWETAEKGGTPDTSSVDGDPQEDLYHLEAFEMLLGHKISEFDSHDKAIELAQQSDDPAALGKYERLLMARELMTRLRDGRIVLASFHPTRGPIVAVGGSAEMRERELKLRKY